MKNRKRFQGFTLVELLVVIAIIGILIGLLLPAVQQVRSAARRIQCASQQRQMALASLNFLTARERFPAGQYFSTLNNNSTDSGWGWRTDILPFIEQENLFQQFDLDLKLNDPAHVSLLQTRIPIFFCPSDSELNNELLDLTNGVSSVRCNYIGNGGAFLDSFRPQIPQWNAVLGRTEDTSYTGIFLANISDGTSNTIYTGEVLGHNFQWDPALYGYLRGNTACHTLSQVRTGDGLLNPPDESSIVILRNSFSSNHVNGMNFAFCDGSTRFIGDDIQHNQLTYNAFLADRNQLGVFQRLLGRDEGLPNGDF